MSKAKKYDQGKPSISLIPKSALWGMAQAFTYGANKYGKWNYKEGMEYTRLADAAYRHLSQFMDGEDIDQESGNNHLYHALASIAMLVDAYENNKDMDDRFKPKRIESPPLTEEEKKYLAELENEEMAQIEAEHRGFEYKSVDIDKSVTQALIKAFDASEKCMNVKPVQMPDFNKILESKNKCKCGKCEK